MRKVKKDMIVTLLIALGLLTVTVLILMFIPLT